jgi:hypothetical protein
MRKIMLAATAIAGLGLATAANAQQPLPAATANPVPGAPTYYTNQFTVPGSFAPSMDIHAPNPAPGTFLVRVNAKVYTGIFAQSDSGSNYTNPTNGLTEKLNPVNIQTAMRLYFQFDGVTPSAIEYGARIELRQSYSYQSQPGGIGNLVQVRRENLYVGTPAAGRVWMGVVDGPISNMVTGEPGAMPFDVVGGWVGDTNAYGLTPGTSLNYMWLDTSPEYMTNKIVYQSPSLAGFDFGVSFEPNYYTGVSQCANITTATCLNAASTDYTSTAPSIALTNSSVAAQSNNGFTAVLQRKDTVEAVGRYMGAFGPSKVRLELGTMQAGTVGTTGLAATAATAKPVSLLVAGASVTYGNLLLGANLQAGSMNTSTAPIVKGQKNTTAVIAEVQYIIGNVTVGASYLNELSPGTAYENASGAVVNGAHMLHEVGYNVGGTWDFATGASAYVSAIYGDRHQAGVNLIARGSAEGVGGQSGWNTGANTLHNSTSARAIAVGTVFNF